MLPGRKYTPQNVARILRERLWLILPPMAVGIAAGVFVFRHLPKQFRSETVILVVPQRIPDEYVRVTGTNKIEDRLPSISDQIISRSRLEKIIVDFDLYKQARAKSVMEDVVQRMRGDIDVKIQGDAKDDSKASFRVSYVSAEPHTAQAVTQALASLYIEENLRDRANLAEDTNQFLGSELANAKQQLIEHEKKLEEYRRRYAGQMPSQLQATVQAIQNAQLQLQNLNESTNRTRERRLLIERQLADAQATPVLETSPPQGDAVPLTAAQQLTAAQAKLEAYRQRYTEDHPDVKALERTVKELEARAAEEAKHSADSPVAPPTSAADLARRNRIQDFRAELEVIDHQLATSQAEEDRLKKVIAGYQADVDAVPTRESELVELTRDYSTLQATYASLLQKQEESKLAANLERRQIGDQFKVLDPASLPERPVNQSKRLGALVGGAVGGVLLGLLSVAFLEYRDSTFRTEQEVSHVLALPVLALVPKAKYEADVRAERRRQWVVRLAGTLVFALGAAAALFFWIGRL